MKQHEAGFRGGSKSGERRQSEILLENQQGISFGVYATKASENIKNSGANSDSENQRKQLKSLECQLINKIKPKLNYTYNRS